MSETYTFPCGCAWPVAGPPPYPGAHPLVDIDQNHMPFCPATFALLKTGRAKGVFQLESKLGQTWTKRMAPETAEHLSALGALLRPGALHAKDERGVSMTELFCRRKNGEETAEAFHPSLKDILGPTEQVITYQEQILRICGELAGMTATERDACRAAIGKKDVQALAKVERVFKDGVAATGVVTKEQGDAIWANIQKSGRYLFNRSHSMSYGLTGYDTAYLKAHVPLAFYSNWLLFAKDGAHPREEIAELVQDARYFNVEVVAPDIRVLEPLVALDGPRVRFGLTDVKGVGESQFAKLLAAARAGEAAVGRPFALWTWEEFLLHAAPAVSATAVRGWAAAGAFAWTGKSRKRLANEYAAFAKLTDKEVAWCAALPAGTAVVDMIAARAVPTAKKGDGGCAAKRAAVLASEVALLRTPPASEDDHPNSVAAAEEHYLGVAVSCSRVDGCDTTLVDTTCREFADGKGKGGGTLFMGVTVETLRTFKTKSGKNPGKLMGFLTVSDQTCALDDVCVFPEAWAAYAATLRAGNQVLLQGKRDPKKGSFVVDRAFQL